MRDRYGAYFNDDSLPGLHDRLIADYPGYDDYIAEFRVADAKGNVLYPTAETRKFLRAIDRTARAEAVVRM